MVKETFLNLKQAKKQRITDALVHEFSTYPLAKAKVSRIVQESGIARGAFYKYFDDIVDAYQYAFQIAIKSVHAGINPQIMTDKDALYQAVCDYVENVTNCPYKNLIKLHLSENERVLEQDLKQYSQRTCKLDAKNWALMVLSHETINLALFDPDNQTQILARFKQALEILFK